MSEADLGGCCCTDSQDAPGGASSKEGCRVAREDSQEAQFNLPIASDEKTIPYLATDRRRKRNLNKAEPL